MGDLTKNFSVKEFARPPRKGFPKEAPYPTEWIETRLKPLAEALQVLREELGQAIHVGSGYRDPAYNTAIGGAVASQHMEGRAADITVTGVAPSVVHATVLKLYMHGLIKIGGLGQYPTFTHIDVRPSPKLVRWVGGRTSNDPK